MDLRCVGMVNCGYLFPKQIMMFLKRTLRFFSKCVCFLCIGLLPVEEITLHTENLQLKNIFTNKNNTLILTV